MLVRLKCAPPFDFERSLRFLCRAPKGASAAGFSPFLDHWRGREYRRVVSLGSRPALLRLRNNGSLDRPAIELRSAPEDLAPAERDAARDVAAHILAAEVGLEEFYSVARRDAVLARLAREFAGVKVMRAPSLYECLVAAILEQQLNFTFAATVKRRLLELCGARLEFEGETYLGFPPPARLAALTPAELRPLQISERKASYIIGVAQAFVGGELQELSAAEVAGAPPEEHLDRLMALRGVGRWTAEYSLLRGLGHSDALPAGDVGLQKTVAHLYGLRAYATPLGIRRRWRALAPWRGYAAYYCWFTQWE